MLASTRALARGSAFGFLEDDIVGMVKRAAHYTHPIGNFRFRKFWFLIEDDLILAMGKIGPGSQGARVYFADAGDCKYCAGTMRTVMVDDDDGSEEIIPCPRMTNRDLPLCDL